MSRLPADVHQVVASSRASPQAAQKRSAHRLRPLRQNLLPQAQHQGAHPAPPESGHRRSLSMLLRKLLQVLHGEAEPDGARPVKARKQAMAVRPVQPRDVHQAEAGAAHQRPPGSKESDEARESLDSVEARRSLAGSSVGGENHQRRGLAGCDRLAAAAGRRFKLHGPQRLLNYFICNKKSFLQRVDDFSVPHLVHPLVELLVGCQWVGQVIMLGRRAFLQPNEVVDVLVLDPAVATPRVTSHAFHDPSFAAEGLGWKNLMNT